MFNITHLIDRCSHISRKKYTDTYNMAIQTFDFVGIVLLMAAVGLAIWWFVIAWKYKTHVASSIFARGANVASSDKKAMLSCDDGHEICIYRATMICTNPNANNFEARDTDPIASGIGEGNTRYGEYNPRKTTSLTAHMGSACNGKQTCEYDFSTQKFPAGITALPDNTQLISSYTCIPHGTACVASM